MPAIEELLVVIDSSTEALRREMRRGNREVEQFSRRTDRQLSRIDSRFVALAASAKRLTKQFVGLAGVGSAGLFGTKVLTQFADFDRSMVRINTLVGISKDQVDAWRQELIALGPAVGKTPNELADALFFVTSAGLRGKSAIAALTAGAKASAIGLGETKAVALAAASAMNAYGEANLNAEKATAIVFGAVREGNLDAETLAGTIGQVISVAAEMGVSFDQVAASIAALSRTGNSAELAATQLSATLSSLLKPSQGQINAAEEINLSFEEMRRKLKEEGLLSLLLELKRRFDGNAVALAQVFPNVRALRGVLSLVGNNAKTNIEVFKSLEEQTIETFEKAFGVQAVSASGKLDAALATLKTQINSLGETVVPPAVRIIDDLGTSFKTAADNVQSFIDKSPELKKALEFAVNPPRGILDRLFGRGGDEPAPPPVPGVPADSPIGVSATIAGLPSLQLIEEVDQKFKGVGATVEILNKKIAISPIKIDEMNQEMERAREIGESVASSLDDAFSDFLDNGKFNFKDFADSAIKDLARIALRQAITAPLGNAIAGAVQGFSLPIGPGRASGGRVVPGMQFPVGERGPERFVPDVPGTIIPNGKFNQAPSLEVNVFAPPGTTASQTGTRQTGSGFEVDILIEAVDNGIGQRISQGRSPTGDAVRSRFGLSPGLGAR